jgi:type I site-specific restriction endonuclease
VPFAVIEAKHNKLSVGIEMQRARASAEHSTLRSPHKVAVGLSGQA